MSDNWYLVLELEINPPVQDEALIEARIEEKKRFWSRHFNDFKNGAQYRRWVQCIPQMRKDMIGPDNRRGQIADEAIVIYYSSIDALLRSLSIKGYITEVEVTRLAEKEKIAPDLIRGRARSIGIIIRHENAADNALYLKYDTAREPGWPTFDSLKDHLAAFGVKDLYAFLSLGFPQTLCAADDPQRLLNAAQEKKQREYYKADSISGSGSKLCSAAELIFSDAGKKASYDRYLSFRQIREVLDEIRKVSEISGYLTRRQADEYAARIAPYCIDHDPPAQVIASFAQAKGIPVVSQPGQDEAASATAEEDSSAQDIARLQAAKRYIDRVWEIAGHVAALDGELQKAKDELNAMGNDQPDHSRSMVISSVCFAICTILAIVQSMAPMSDDPLTSFFAPLLKLLIIVEIIAAAISAIVLIVIIIGHFRAKNRTKAQDQVIRAYPAKRKAALQPLEEWNRTAAEERSTYLSIFRHTLTTPLQVAFLLELLEQKKAPDLRKAMEMYEEYADSEHCQLKGIDTDYYKRLAEQAQAEASSDLKRTAEEMLFSQGEGTQHGR